VADISGIPAVPPAAAEESHLLPIAVSTLRFTTRTANCLAAAAIATVEELTAFTAGDLLALPNFGVTSLRDVEERLAHRGLALAGSAVPPPVPVFVPSDHPAVCAQLRSLCAEMASDSPDATVAEVIAALASGATAIWVSSQAASAFLAARAADVAGPLVAAYRWQDVLADARARMDERSQVILDLWVDERPTLQEVSDLVGVTRERVRQLLCQSLAAFASSPVVGRAGERLAALLHPYCSVSALREAGFNPDASDTRLLLQVAAHLGLLPRTTVLSRSVLAGVEWVNVAASRSPASVVGQAVSGRPRPCAPRQDIIVAVNAALAGRATPAEADLFIATSLADTTRWRTLGHLVADWTGNLLDKAELVLYAEGASMDRTALIQAVGPASERSLLNQLYSPNGRIVRTADGRLALPEWDDVARYEPCVELMKRLITEHGGRISLSRLAREVTAQSLFSPTSVNMNVSMRPEFVLDVDVVRLRRPDEPLEVKAPETDRDLLRVLDGPDRGAWSWAFEVNYERLRVGSATAPAPMAVLLGLNHEVGTVLDINGAPVKARWSGDELRLFSSGGFKALCHSLGAVDGDSVVLAAAGTHCLHAAVRHPVPAGAGPAERLCHRLGWGSAETLLGALGYAIGFDGALDVDFSADDVLERLRVRRDNDTTALLLEIHPELAD